VVHAGDLFHDRRPTLSDIMGTLDVLEDLADADIPFLAVVGNHEAKRDAQWLDLYASLGLATRLDDEPTLVGDTAFYGLDFVPRSKRDDLDYEFDPHDADHAALVSHGLFSPLVPDYGNVEWDAEEVLAEANREFDAMLLGDEHAATREQLGGTWVTYCGSTERTSASERDERGYNIVEFDDGVSDGTSEARQTSSDGGVHISRRGIGTRDLVFVDLELGESEGFDRVRDRVREHGLTDAVVHVSLEGDGEDVSAARIEEFAADAGALVARVTDRREVSEETYLEVAFADPDEAVRERVRDLGLSGAARDLDEMIRASKIADSNVADEAEDRVADLLDDPSAFDSAPDEDTETVADRMDDDASTDGTAEATEPDDATDPNETETETEQPTADPAETDGQQRPAAQGEDQASMEDYL
jgi:DNA repair exonuclease SbcCD nuclease subunit